MLRNVVGRIWCVALIATVATLSLTESSIAQQTLPLHEKRASASDLKLSGTLPGVPKNAVRFVSYSDLLKLQQVTLTVSNDSNFKGKTEISGVYLEQLLRTLAVADKGTLISAICDDGYEGHYSSEYRTAHHPILVLRVNGEQPSKKSRRGDDGNYGPYLVSQASFVPRFKVFAYTEEAQNPNGVLELRFEKETKVTEATKPPGEFAAGSLQLGGYRIARENCLRCHNTGAYGGHKSGKSWEALEHIAQANPSTFVRYIRDPRSINALAQMPGFPEYDSATLSALTAYFQTFVSENGSK